MLCRRAFTRVDPALAFPLLRVEAMALEAVFREDRPNVPIEFNLRGATLRQRRGEDQEGEQEAAHRGDRFIPQNPPAAKTREPLRRRSSVRCFGGYALLP